MFDIISKKHFWEETAWLLYNTEKVFNFNSVKSSHVVAGEWPWVTLKSEFYLDAAARTVTADDADVRWIKTGADESIDVVVCEVFHHAQLFLDCSSYLSQRTLTNMHS